MASPSGSADEGEIIENGVDDLKATTLPDLEGNGVDRRDRNRGRYSRSPGSDNSRSYGNSTYRAASPRGYKRSRDDRDSYYHGSRDSDPRRFRVHYEDTPRDERRRGGYRAAGADAQTRRWPLGRCDTMLHDRPNALL